MEGHTINPLHPLGVVVSDNVGEEGGRFGGGSQQTGDTAGSRLRLEEREELFPPEDLLLFLILLAVDAVLERLLLLLEFENLLFDAVFDDEFVDEDRLVLSDPIRPVGRLVFDGGVPPRVVVDDGVGGDEVEANTAGLEADEENVGFARGEAGDRFFALAGGAGEFGVGDFAPFDLPLKDREHGGELGEDQHLAPFIHQLIDQFEEEIELGGVADFLGAFEFEELRVAAHLPELEEGVEDRDVAAGEPFGCDGFAHLFLHRDPDVLIQGGLFGVEDGAFDDLSLGGEFEGDGLFGAAEDEGTDPAVEFVAAGEIVLFFDRVLVKRSEEFEIAEEPRHHEVEDRPQFAQVVFDRGAAEGEAVGGGEGFDRLCHLGGGVFDLLGFIEDDVLEALPDVVLGIALGELVGGEEDVVPLHLVELVEPVGAVEGEVGQMGGEFVDLVFPVAHQGGGHDDEHRGGKLPVVLEAVEEGEGLEGFSQSHVVGEDATEAERVEKCQPREPQLLIAAEGRLKSGGGVDRFDPLEVAQFLREGFEFIEPFPLNRLALVEGDEMGIVGVDDEGAACVGIEKLEDRREEGGDFGRGEVEVLAGGELDVEFLGQSLGRVIAGDEGGEDRQEGEFSAPDGDVKGEFKPRIDPFGIGRLDGEVLGILEPEIECGVESDVPPRFLESGEVLIEKTAPDLDGRVEVGGAGEVRPAEGVAVHPHRFEGGVVCGFRGGIPDDFEEGIAREEVLLCYERERCELVIPVEVPQLHHREHPILGLFGVEIEGGEGRCFDRGGRQVVGEGNGRGAWEGLQLLRHFDDHLKWHHRGVEEEVDLFGGVRGLEGVEAPFIGVDCHWGDGGGDEVGAGRESGAESIPFGGFAPGEGQRLRGGIVPEGNRILLVIGVTALNHFAQHDGAVFPFETARMGIGILQSGCKKFLDEGAHRVGDVVVPVLIPERKSHVVAGDPVPLGDGARLEPFGFAEFKIALGVHKEAEDDKLTVCGCLCFGSLRRFPRQFDEGIPPFLGRVSWGDVGGLDVGDEGGCRVFAPVSDRAGTVGIDQVVSLLDFVDVDVLGVELATEDFGAEEPRVGIFLVEVKGFDPVRAVVLLPPRIGERIEIVREGLEGDIGSGVHRDVLGVESMAVTVYSLNSADPTRTMLEPHAMASS